MNIGVFQGSTFSCLLYLIYTIDIHGTTHKFKHTSNLNIHKCNSPTIEAYIDDAFSIIKGTKDDIWIKIKKYTVQINEYYTNNGLINNIDKTNDMLISKDNPTLK